MLDPSSIHQSRSLDLIFALIMQPDCVYFTVEGRKRPLSLFPLFALEVLLQAFSPSAARQQNFPWPLSPRHVPLTGTWEHKVALDTGISFPPVSDTMESWPVARVQGSKTRTSYPWRPVAWQSIIFIHWHGLLMLSMLCHSVCQNDGLNTFADHYCRAYLYHGLVHSVQQVYKVM